MDESSLRQRISQLLSPSNSPEGNSEVVYGAIRVLEAVYGPEGSLTIALRQQLFKAIERWSGTPGTRVWLELSGVARSALQNLQKEIEGGFVGSLKKQIASEVLADFTGLAKWALNQEEEGAKNVAAVLVAAAFEDVIRRMGSKLAGVVDNNNLKDVIDALKSEGVLQSPQLTIALSYLTFRNYALHANWDKIERASVYGVLGFVEQLLLKHFT